jgi:hypothetical protein
MTTPIPGNADGSAVVPGHRDKYALIERERRFLLAGPPSGVRAASAARPDGDRGAGRLRPGGLRPGRT